MVGAGETRERQEDKDAKREMYVESLLFELRTSPILRLVLRLFPTFNRIISFLKNIK